MYKHSGGKAGAVETGKVLETDITPDGDHPGDVIMYSCAHKSEGIILLGIEADSVEFRAKTSHRIRRKLTQFGTELDGKSSGLLKPGELHIRHLVKLRLEFDHRYDKTHSAAEAIEVIRGVGDPSPDQPRLDGKKAIRT